MVGGDIQRLQNSEKLVMMVFNSANVPFKPVEKGLDDFLAIRSL